MRISKLNADRGVTQILKSLDETYLDDAVATVSQDMIAFSRFKRADQDIDKFCAGSKIVLAWAGGHLFAILPRASVPAQLIGAAMLSGANRKLA